MKDWEYSVNTITRIAWLSICKEVLSPTPMLWMKNNLQDISENIPLKLFKGLNSTQDKHLNSIVHISSENAFLMPRDTSIIICFTRRNCSQISRWARMSSSSFISANINDVFGPSFALVTHYLLQRPNAGGYVRSKLDMQKIADWS